MDLDIREKLIINYLDGFSADGREYAEYFIDNVSDRALFNDEVTTALHLVDKRLMLDGREIELPYIVALATLKSCRGCGEAGALIYNTLKFLKGKPFVALYPFNHNYYTQYGFVTIDFETEFLAPKDVVYEPTADYAMIAELYNDYFARFNGRLIRSVEDIKKKCTLAKIAGGDTYVLKHNNRAVGYLIDDSGELREGVPFVVTDKPNVQMRICDIPAALKSCSYLKDGEFIINVDDSFYRSGRYEVKIVNGSAKVKALEKGVADIEVTQQQLTKLIINGEDGSEYFPKRNILLVDKC